MKRLDTGIRRFQQEILKQLFLTKAEHCRVHFTSNTSHKNGRFLVNAVKPYQGNRKSKAKPPLVEPLRQAIAHRENWLDEFSVVLHHDIEADDGMMIEAYQYGENGIIWSDDKDLRMTPYPYWCKEKGVILPSQKVGWVQPKFTPAGAMKLIGQGPLFFWAQMLMGDQADHIQGVLRYNGKLCGPSTAYEVLGGVTDINVAANLVLDAYRVIDQNPLPEAYLLWLLRTRDDHVIHYLNSLELSEDNRRFLHECNGRPWFNTSAS